MASVEANSFQRRKCAPSITLSLVQLWPKNFTKCKKAKKLDKFNKF